MTDVSVLLYQINYWMEQSQTELMAIFRDVKGDTDSGMIIGLNVETYYRINVQVYNSAGYGPKSSYWIEETLRSGEEINLHNFIWKMCFWVKDLLNSANNIKQL